MLLSLLGWLVGFGCILGIWKFPGRGLNLIRSHGNTSP